MSGLRSKNRTAEYNRTKRTTGQHITKTGGFVARTRKDIQREMARKPISGDRRKLAAAEFQKQFDLWLRQTEDVKPFAKLRELAERIGKGESKLKAAELRGVAPDDETYAAAAEKLAALKTEEAQLRRDHQMPFFALNTIHNFLKASRGWGMPDGSYIEFVIPGIFSMAVDLAENEIPF